MNPSEDRELWTLLGKAREPRISPFFSRNVLRSLETRSPGTLQNTLSDSAWRLSDVLTALLRPRLAPIGLAALLCLTSWIFLPIGQEKNRQNDINQIAHLIASSPDYGVISQLDELLASEEGNLWLETSPL
mgnify:CR=1 FL=1